MDKDFLFEYSKRSDDELLRLATDRASLTARADAALTDELHRRSLKESDLAKHQRSVRHYEKVDSKSRRRRIFGISVGRLIVCSMHKESGNGNYSGNVG